MKKIPNKLQKEVVTLRKEGKSHRYISRLLKIGLGTVFNYSKGIILTGKQHRSLMLENYYKNLASLPKEKLKQAARRGGANSTLKYRSQTKNKIIKLIQGFYKKIGRIPLKQEFYHAKAARLRFGSWNKAVKASGFFPNPVMFARKHIAKDGHKCDSFAEMIIDDWLYVRNIPHERSVPYIDTRFNADFKVNGSYIEFFGLHGQHKVYDNHMKEKLKIIRKNKLKVIHIYQKDLFPKLKLDFVLKELL